MKTHRRSIYITTTIEWHRRLRAIYAANSGAQFIKKSFELILATVHCDFLLFHDFSNHNEPVAITPNGAEYGCGLLYQLFERCVTDSRRRPKLVSFDSMPVSGNNELSNRPSLFEQLASLGTWRCISILFHEDENYDSLALGFSIFRSGQKPEFSNEEIVLLENIHGHLETAIIGLRSRHVVESKHDGLAAVVRDLPLGAVVLDSKLQIAHANRKGMENFASWSCPSTGCNIKIKQIQCSVPEDIKTVCRELHSEWSTALRKRDPIRLKNERAIQHRDDNSLRAIVTLLYPRSPGFSQPGFLVQTDRRTKDHDYTRHRPNSCLDLLTISEREVALCAAKGRSNQEIADDLGKSVSAVKFLLHSIFKKVQVSSRAHLIAQLRAE